jgi:hypothetical protein
MLINSGTSITRCLLTDMDVMYCNLIALFTMFEMAAIKLRQTTVPGNQAHDYSVLIPNYYKNKYRSTGL